MPWRHSVAVAVIAAIAVLPNMLGPLNLYDGGLSASAGTFLLHGELPYRDFWWLYGPASGILVAIPTAVFGPSLLIPRLLGLLVVMAQAGIGYGILRSRVRHLGAAVIAIGAVAPAVVVTHLDVSAWTVSTALVFAAILLRTVSSRRPVWVGVVLGAAFLARLDVGGYGLLAMLLLAGRRDVVAGFAAVAVPFVAFELLTTPLADLYEQLIWFPLIGTREFRAVPPSDLSDGVVLLITLPVIVIPKAAIAAAAVRLTVLRERPPAFLVLTAFAALCQLQTLGRSDLYHQGQAATAGFLLLGLWIMTPGRAAPDRDNRPMDRMRRSGALAVVASLCGFAFFTGTLSVARMQRGPLLAGDSGFIAGVRTLVANTSRDDPVYVGLTSHRFTFINPMFAYYLADRRAGVRVAMFNPGITNTDRVQTEMVADMTASGTELLLLDAAFAEVSEETNSSRIPGSTVLDGFIARNYLEACRFEDTRILVLRDRVTPVVCVQPTSAGLNEILTDIGAGD